MFTIAMTPEQFAAAKAAVAASKQVYAHTETSEMTGVFSTTQVTLSYAYDGDAQLALKVEAAHGLAKFASDEQIKAHLVALLQQA